MKESGNESPSIKSALNSFREAVAAVETAARDATDVDFIPAAARAFIALVNLTHSRLTTPAQLAMLIDYELQEQKTVVTDDFLDGTEPPAKEDKPTSAKDKSKNKTSK